jgi:hypothetical protein
MIHELNGRVIKILGTKYPRLRHLIRNHPYSKIVGIGVIKCLLEDMHMTSDEISDNLLKDMVERGIELYHENENKIDEFSVLEQKRKFLCKLLKQIAENHLETTAS